MIEQRYPFVEIGGATDPGRKRAESPNQDAIGMIEPNEWLRRPAGLIVSDGMGGYNGGEIASRTAIETFTASFRFGLLTRSAESAIRQGIDAAHRAIKRISAQDAEHGWMGCTIVVALLTLLEVRREACYRWLDCLLLLPAGLAGCILAFLAFFSVHPAMWPNVTLLWLHPFHLVGLVLVASKGWKRATYVYHFLTFAALLAAAVGYFIIPQHANLAFIPLMLILLIRSGRNLTRRKKIRFE